METGPVIRKKICLLGAPSVGKTSLVRQFVDSMFDEHYQRTIGVKIDKKTVTVDAQELVLMLWDMHGEDDDMPVRDSYLRGLNGYLLVVDSTRPDTLAQAGRVHERVQKMSSGVPYILVLNKSDLLLDWHAIDQASAPLAQDAQAMIKTSARTGQAVNDCFSTLGRALLR